MGEGGGADALDTFIINEITKSAEGSKKKKSKKSEEGAAPEGEEKKHRHHSKKEGEEGEKEGEKGEKAALVEALRKAATEVSTRVREELGEAGEGMAFAFEGEALVRQCYTVLWIVLGSIAGLCIMAFCAVIVYRRWRQNHIVQFSKRTL